jgi:hypothetical protein
MPSLVLSFTWSWGDYTGPALLLFLVVQRGFAASGLK